MGTQGPGRKRIPNRNGMTAEEDALNIIAREAEARLAAKRAARAEAREIRMKELERQQKEVSDDDERMSVGSRSSFRVDDKLDRDYMEKGSSRASTLSAATLASLGGTSSRRGSGDTSITADTEASIREIKEIHELKDQIQDVEAKYMQSLKEVKDSLSEVEEKYRKAMVSNAQLDNEKSNLIYQVDTLKDSLMELEELLAETRREYEERTKELEREKHAHGILQFQFNDLKETLKQSEELLTALERQKEYSDAIRNERDELRDEVVQLKDILKVLDCKHGIVLGPDLTTNGDIGETDGSAGTDQSGQNSQTSSSEVREGTSILGTQKLRPGKDEKLMAGTEEQDHQPKELDEDENGKEPTPVCEVVHAGASEDGVNPDKSENDIEEPQTNEMTVHDSEVQEVSTGSDVCITAEGEADLGKTEADRIGSEHLDVQSEKPVEAAEQNHTESTKVSEVTEENKAVESEVNVGSSEVVAEAPEVTKTEGDQPGEDVCADPSKQKAGGSQKEIKASLPQDGSASGKKKKKKKKKQKQKHGSDKEEGVAKVEEKREESLIEDEQEQSLVCTSEMNLESDNVEPNKETQEEVESEVNPKETAVAESNGEGKVDVKPGVETMDSEKLKCTNLMSADDAGDSLEAVADVSPPVEQTEPTAVLDDPANTTESKASTDIPPGSDEYQSSPSDLTCNPPTTSSSNTQTDHDESHPVTDDTNSVTPRDSENLTTTEVSESITGADSPVDTVGSSPGHDAASSEPTESTENCMDSSESTSNLDSIKNVEEEKDEKGEPQVVEHSEESGKTEADLESQTTDPEGCVSPDMDVSAALVQEQLDSSDVKEGEEKEQEKAEPVLTDTCQTPPSCTENCEDAEKASQEKVIGDCTDIECGDPAEDDPSDAKTQQEDLAECTESSQENTISDSHLDTPEKDTESQREEENANPAQPQEVTESLPSSLCVEDADSSVKDNSVEVHDDQEPSKDNEEVESSKGDDMDLATSTDVSITSPLDQPNEGMAGSTEKLDEGNRTQQEHEQSDSSQEMIPQHDDEEEELAGNQNCLKRDDSVELMHQQPAVEEEKADDEDDGYGDDDDDEDEGASFDFDEADLEALKNVDGPSKDLTESTVEQDQIPTDHEQSSAPQEEGSLESLKPAVPDPGLDDQQDTDEKEGDGEPKQLDVQENDDRTTEKKECAEPEPARSSQELNSSQPGTVEKGEQVISSAARKGSEVAEDSGGQKLEGEPENIKTASRKGSKGKGKGKGKEDCKMSYTEIRLRKLVDERESLIEQVKRLKGQLEQKKQTPGAEGGPSPDGEVLENGTDPNIMEMQRDANRQITDLKFKLAKAEQDVTALEQNVTRLEGQVTRYKSASENAEKVEDEIKAEKRKLQRELRSALDKIEELEASNSHLSKRLEKMKSTRGAAVTP
ncbi:leucine-rich repeat flightless-interacting protein 1 [Chanos chanos]|uniref:Leucine-rich repeat flightless-interacting protein 1 n=1 Tax=Chanos chanos TaxID=29144 RepID=A0A6J2WDL7_CHACN|nr:leucine-rich repeat flightless-interacting protein 1-like [Chanos chanos]